MKITLRQLRRIIKEELKLSEQRRPRRRRADTPAEDTQTDKERLEALVAESPQTRALGEGEMRGVLQMATNLAQARAREKLAEITGKDTVSAIQIDAAFDGDVYYSVMELQ